MSKPLNALPRHAHEILEDQGQDGAAGSASSSRPTCSKAQRFFSDRNVILDLIYNEIVLREQVGDRPEQQEYAQRFPLFSAELALQFEVDSGLDWKRAAELLSGDELRLHDLKKGKLDCSALADQLGITPDSLREKLARAADRAAHDQDAPET